MFTQTLTAATLFVSSIGMNTQGVANQEASYGAKPFIHSVSSKQGWTTTGIEVSAGETLCITHHSGLWNGDGGRHPRHGPDGPTVDAYNAPSGYPLPGAMEDSVVGRVGGEVFFVGSNLRKKIKKSGVLYLTINDTGYHDNSGSIKMSITIE